MLMELNLRLFDADTQTTLLNAPGNDLSPEMKTWYEKRLITMAEPQLIHDQFADKYPIPKRGGKTIEFRKLDPLPKALVPLTEGVTPDGQNLNVTAITATVEQYGGYVKTSDVLDLTAVDPMVELATESIASQAGRTLDTVTREVLVGGTNVLYAPKVGGNGAQTEVNSRYQLDSSARLTMDLVRRAATLLKRQNAPQIDGSYVAIVHPDVAGDLMSEKDGWIDVNKYTNADKIFEGEIGKLAGVRFVENSEAKVFYGADLSASARNLTVKAAVSAAATVTVNEALVAGALAGRQVLIGGARYEVVSNTVGAITLNASVTASIGDAIAPGEGGAGGAGVYATMFLGAHAYAVTEVSGGGLTHHVKPLGSAGSADPLNQRATVGWKAIKTAERLIEPYMLRVESGSSLSDKALAN